MRPFPKGTERVARALAEQAIRERRRWDTDPDRLEEMLPQAIEHAWLDFTEQAAVAVLAYQRED